MCYTVYILYSASADRYYIGQTADIEDRIKRHNAGSEKATAPYTPWQLIWTTQKATRAEAMQLEKKLKNLSRIRLQAFIEKYS
ncbi:MAG: GIY-YIG nuclease family protein [Chitinophagaceae bacterium]